MPQPLHNKGLVIASLVVALAGFIDAAYLTLEHFMNAIPPCSIGSCETVLTSTYSTILGIPMSLLGAIYYLVILVALFAYLDAKKDVLLKVALVLPLIGFVFTLWLIYLQLFVIHAICVYCMGSATSTTLLAILSLVIFSKRRAVDTLAQ